MDAETGRTPVRLVDLDSASYQVAVEYMIRLTEEDFSDEKQLAALADEAGLSPQAFREQFEHVVKGR